MLTRKSFAWQNFLHRLEQAKTPARPMSQRLRKLITPTQLNKIISYFLVEDKQAEKIDFHVKETLNFHTLKTKITQLKPGKSYGIPKKKSGLARTLTVLNDWNNVLRLVVETKSKLANGKKHQLPKMSGDQKKGKVAWGIDSTEAEWINFVVACEREDSYADMLEEINIAKDLGKDRISSGILGEVNSQNGHERFNVHMLKAQGKCLEDAIADGDIAKLSEKEKNELILDILEEVKLLHSKGYIHQDLKTANILLHHHKPQIIDFGLTVKKGENIDALASNEYQSPEIAYYYGQLTEDNEYYHNYFTADQKKCLAFHSLKESPYQAPKEQFRKADSKNDMWALGIIIYEIRYGQWDLPKDFKQVKKKIQTDPLLSRILIADREARIDIHEALKEHQTSLKKRKTFLQDSLPAYKRSKAKEVLKLQSKPVIKPAKKKFSI